MAPVQKARQHAHLPGRNVIVMTGMGHVQRQQSHISIWLRTSPKNEGFRYNYLPQYQCLEIPSRARFARLQNPESTVFRTGR